MLVLPLLAWLALFLPLWAYLPPQPRAVLPQSQELPLDRAFVQFSPDGGTLLTLSASHNRCPPYLGSPLGLWNARTGHRKAVLGRGPGFFFTHLVFSPDSKWLATNDAEGTPRLWDVARGEVVANLPGRTGGLTVCDPFWFSSDSRALVVESQGIHARRSLLRLLNVPDGRERAVAPPDGDDYFGQVQFSPDGRLLATARQRGGLQVWDVTTGEQRALLPEQGIPGTEGFWFSPDGVLLACRHDRSSLSLWDVRTLTLQATLPGAFSQRRVYESGPRDWPPRVLLFSGDSKMLVTESEEGIKTWEMPTGRLRDLISDPEEHLALGNLSRDGSLLVTITDPRPGGLALGRYRLWDVRATPARPLGGPLAARPQLLPQEGLVAVYDPRAGTLGVLNARTGENLSTITYPGPRTGKSLAPWDEEMLSADGRHVVEERDEEDIPSLFLRWLPWLGWKPGSVGKPVLWDLRTGRQEAPLGRGKFLAFSPDGNTLVTQRMDGSIALLDVPPHRSALLLFGPPSLLALLVALACSRLWTGPPQHAQPT